MASPPQKIGDLALNHSEPRTYLENLKSTIGFTQAFNVSGGAAMSVPLSVSGSGLPIGIQFAGPLNADRLLFQLAAQLERAQPWDQHLPVES